jgi:hypothetical protein
MFYHFTSETHLPLILDAGYLKLSESNVGSGIPSLPPFGDHAGPDVVWLLDVPTVRHHSHGLAGASVDKTAIRFTVHAPDAVRWLNWQPAMQMHPEWRQIFVRVGGGSADSRHWYVVEHEIHAADWLEIRDMKTGEVIPFTA